MTMEEFEKSFREEFEKSFFEVLMGNPIVFDENGNSIKFCDIPPAQRIEYIEYKDFTFEELKKAFEDTYQVMNKGNKRAEQAALKAYPKEEGKVWSSAFGTFEFDKTAPERTAYRQGYEQAEKDLIPLINRLCEAILFDWDNKAELAREIQSKIKEEE